MKILFIQSFLNEDYHNFKSKLLIVAIMWAFVWIAMALDLISGVRKAKERGEARTSYGLRRTVTKAVLYCTLMLFAFMGDCIGTFFYELPCATFIATAFLIFIEGKSILEKAHEKDKRKLKENAEYVSILFENKDDILKGIAEVIKTKQNDTN